MRKKKYLGLALQIDLVLMLIAVFIICAIVLVGAKSFLDNQRIAKARADCAQMGTAISQYRMEIGKLPASMNEVKTNLTKTNGQYGAWLTKTDWKDAWGNDYVYKVSSNGSSTGTDARSFVIYSLGANQKDDGSNADSGISQGDIGFWGK